MVTSVMMLRSGIFSIFFLLALNLGLFTAAAAQCEIGTIEANATPCDEQGYFNVVIDFEYANVGTQGFTVQGNGATYGNFEYTDLPVTINDLPGDGITFYEFVVRDIEFPDCHNFIEFGIVDCDPAGDCHIWDVYADIMPCNESGFFHVLLDFEFTNTGNNGFRVQGNGNNYGNFSYDDLPVTIGPLEGDGVTIYEFVVIDNDLETCHDFTAIDPVDCDPQGGDCEIGAIQATVLPCNEENEFYVLLNFAYANTSDGFTVQGNGVFYGNFLYSQLPVEIGPLQGDGVTVYEFGVHDAVHEACGNAAAIDPVSCEGETALMNFTTQVMSCQDDMYMLKVDFEAVNQGSQGFTLSGNGENYGTFNYEQLPVEIGPLSTDGNTPYYFIAKDLEHPLYGNWERLVPFTCESLDITENSLENDVKIYPNPSSGSVVVEIPEKDDVAIFIYNSSGALLRVFSTRGTYQMNNLHSGIYYYTITDTRGNKATGRLIVSR